VHRIAEAADYVQLQRFFPQETFALFAVKRFQLCAWRQSYDRELQRQRCRKLQRHEQPSAFRNSNNFLLLKKTLKPAKTLALYL
jgi:hypothetical protein